jgi:hypothetical protein
MGSRAPAGDRRTFPGPVSPVWWTVRIEKAATHRIPISIRTWQAVVAVSVVYLAISVFLYHQELLGGSSRMPVLAVGDQAQEVWFLKWPVYALGHGHSPFFTTWMNYPKGVNLTINTSFVLLGLISWPIQLLWGPIVAYNLLLTLALAESAVSMCLALRRWVRTWLAAFVGGLIYGFSPFMIGQGQGHLFLTAGFVLPILLVIFDEILVKQRGSARRYGLALGVLAGVEYYISAEVLAITAVVSGCAMVLLAVAFRHEVRPRVGYAVRALGYAAAVAFVLIAYPVWVTLFGPQHVMGPPHRISGLATYPGHVLAPVLPSHTQHFGPAAWKLRGSELGGSDLAANELYLGIPLLVILVTFSWMFKEVRALLFFVAMLVVSTIFAMGFRLRIDSHSSIPLPAILFRRIPFVQGILPARFSLFMQLFAAAALALGLDLLASRLRASRREPKFVASLIPACVAIVALLPLVPSGPYPGVPSAVPSFYTGQPVKRIPVGGVVLSYPYPANRSDQTLLGQAEAGMRFKIVGSVGYTPAADGRSIMGTPTMSPSIVQSVFETCYRHAPDDVPADDPQLDAATVGGLRTFLARYDISAVVVDPVGKDPSCVVRYVSSALGPGESTGGVIAWFDVSDLLAKRGPSS